MFYLLSLLPFVIFDRASLQSRHQGEGKESTEDDARTELKRSSKPEEPRMKSEAKHCTLDDKKTQACRGYGYPWIYPWIYPCVDIRLQPSCGYIHGYCAVAFAN